MKRAYALLRGFFLFPIRVFYFSTHLFFYLRYKLGLLSIKYEAWYEDNIDFSGFKTDIKTIAYYLPQFHQIPENDQFDIDDDDYSFSDDEFEYIDNWDLYKRDFPEEAMNRLYSYKVTLKPSASDHTNYKCLRAFYVRDGNKALEIVDKQLSQFAVGRCVYSCDKQKIVDIVDGVEFEY